MFPSFTGFYLVLLVFHWGFIGFTQFYWILPILLAFFLVLLVLLSFNRFYHVLLVFHWVFIGFTQFYWILPILLAFFLVPLVFHCFFIGFT